MHHVIWPCMQLQSSCGLSELGDSLGKLPIHKQVALTTLTQHKSIRVCHMPLRMGILSPHARRGVKIFGGCSSKESTSGKHAA